MLHFKRVHMPDTTVKEKLRRLRIAFAVNLVLLLLVIVGTLFLIQVWGTQLGWNIPFVILLAFLFYGVLVDIVYWWGKRDRKKS